MWHGNRACASYARRRIKVSTRDIDVARIWQFAARVEMTLIIDITLVDQNMVCATRFNRSGPLVHGRAGDREIGGHGCRGVALYREVRGGREVVCILSLQPTQPIQAEHHPIRRIGTQVQGITRNAGSIIRLQDLIGGPICGSKPIPDLAKPSRTCHPPLLLALQRFALCPGSNPTFASFPPVLRPGSFR